MYKLLNTILFFGLVFILNTACSEEKKETGKEQPVKIEVNTDSIITSIQKYRMDGEQKLLDNKFSRKVVEFSGDNIKAPIKQKWEKMDVYYDGDKIVRIQLYPHKNSSERTEEFYLIDNKLVFAFIQDKGPKNEGKDAGEPGKEFYFNNDQLLKYDDKSADLETDIEKEKKMYETRLPYEISELLQIIGQK